jgi:hypothetical protein
MPIFHLLRKGFLLQVIDILNQSIVIVIEATPSNPPPSPPFLGSQLLLIKGQLVTVKVSNIAKKYMTWALYKPWTPLLSQGIF